MRALTFLGSTTFSALFCFALVCLNKKLSLNAFYSVTYTMLVGLVFVHTIKRTFGRQRPCHALPQAIIKKLPPINSYSFPSGHTCAAFGMAFALSNIFPALSFLFFTLAALVGISRIYLGMHYPTDVLIGGILGFVSFLITNAIICAII
ncbi:MAG: phosphatase PAP2 family protein [Eubacteriaceae bacterium]|nr:phosphatase PAP2 family protein [Eubacteriaceae bacterium]